MKKYNPKIHNRKSIRLKGYDYAQPGLYFVTICVQNRACLFGDIVDTTLILNDAGIMIEKWYFELENKFPDIRCGTHIVMPNHFHCIIQNIDRPWISSPSPSSDMPSPSSSDISDVRADLCVCPDTSGEHMFGKHTSGEHIGSPLRRVIQWFKTMTTNEYIRHVKLNDWQRFDGKLWQRNYWEHIIRNDKSLQNISTYITNNPTNWNADLLKS